MVMRHGRRPSLDHEELQSSQNLLGRCACACEACRPSCRREIGVIVGGKVDTLSEDAGRWLGSQTR